MEISIKQKQEFNKIEITKLQEGEAGLVFGSFEHNGSIILKINHKFYKIYANRFCLLWEDNNIPNIYYLPIRKLELQYILE